MSTEIVNTALEVLPSKIEQVVRAAGIEGEGALAIVGPMSPFFVQAREWESKVSAVTDPKVARASRLVLRKIRVEASHKKDELKENVIRVGRAIDAAYKEIEGTISPMEETLEGVEKAAERAEAARRAQIKTERESTLAPYNVVTTFYDLVNMPDEVFAELLSDKKAAHEAKLVAVVKAEAERIEREKAEAAERERVRLENERLKKEAAEREAAAKAEREKAETERKQLEAERAAAEAKAKKERDFIEAKAAEEKRNAEVAAKAAAEKARQEREAVEAKAKAERMAREKAEAELKAAKDAEAKRLADIEAARKKAERAPDREKLAAFAQSLRSILVPALSSPEGAAVASQIVDQVEKFAKWVETKAGAL